MLLAESSLGECVMSPIGFIPFPTLKQLFARGL
jgi:hypothetical protein